MGLYSDALLDGWMLSRASSNIAENKGNPSIRDLSVAISVVEFPPLWELESGSTGPLKGTMVPAVQVLEVQQGRTTLFFLRLHPAPSFARA